MFCCYLFEACSFLMRDKKEMNLDGREDGKELGGVKRKNYIQIMIYETMLNNRRKHFNTYTNN